VDGESLTKAREINIGNALVGKVAGVNSTGPLTGPGGSSRVTIRGNSSLTGNNQPLYVVNGVPLNNDNLGSAGKWGGADLGDGISSINPDDIEDMTVLKGAAAAALYGQRAQNGVIMITTKSGKARKGIGLELNSNFTVDQVNDFTDFQTSFGQGTLGNKPTDQASALQTGLSSWGAPLDGSNVTLFDGKQHAYSAQGSNLKGFYQNGSTLTNTLSMYGGSEAATFRVSFGDLRNSAVYPNAKYNRNNVNLDLSYRLSDKWSGAANVSYIKEIGKNRSNLSDGPGNGNYGILFLPPNVNQQYLAPGYDNQLNEIQYYNEPWNTNPHFAANRFQNNTNKDRLVGMMSLRFAPVKWFYVQGRIANDFYAFNAQSITPTGTAYRPTGSLDMDRTILFNESNFDLMAGSHHQVGDFDMNFMVGGNLLRMNSKFSDINANGLAFPFLYNPSAATTRGANISTPKKEVQSIYGSAEISYRNMLFLNITDRNDWSSALPAGNNSYNYPAVSLAWTFSEVYRPSWLNYGKVRFGYAQVGSDTDPFQTMQYYNSLTNVNGAPAGNIGNNIPNSQLQPRKIKELEAGIEFKALQNRLTVDFTVYNKQTLNDIVQGTVSGTSGYESAILNVGKLQNKGIELMVGGTPVKSKHFRWLTNFNYAHNHNKVISLAEGQNFMNIGESRTERGFIQHRLDLPFAQVMVYDFKKDAKGNLVVGPTGLPLASDALVSAGTGIPPITGGWSNDFYYKRWSFSFLIDYKFGGVIYSGTNARAYSYGLHQETLNGRDKGIVVNGVNEAGTAVTTTVSAQNYYTEMSRVSMLHVYDADFIKFRSMVLSYAIPSSVFKQKVQSMTVSLVGRNLFYLMRKTDNIDPESNYNNSNAQGLEYAGLPSVRSYGVNLNVKF
jgi:TonB-linked SusC/RagA family outer membrane protein